MMMRGRLSRIRAAFTLLEIMVSLTIFMIAMIPISWSLIGLMKDSNETVLHTRAVFLAQEKAEELLRDDTVLGIMSGYGGGVTRPALNWEMYTSVRLRRTPTEPLPYPPNPQLYYCYSGSSILYDKSTPEGADNIARVLVLRNKVAPDQITGKDVIYELRFGHE